MTPDEVASLIDAGTAGACERTAQCPDEEQIAAYVDEGLAPAARASLELHLADCNACLALVGLLSRDRATGPIEAVPEIVARARNLVPAKRRSWSASAPQWAVAAGVVIAFSALVFSSQYTAPSAELQGAVAARTTRAVSSKAPTVALLAPRAGSVVDPRLMVFRWTVVPGSHFYEVRVVTDAGDLIAEQRVIGTEWRPAGQLKLQAGGEYYVHVDAFASDSTTVGSEHVPFKVSD